MIEISIIILNYKSRSFTLNCIKSIKEADFNGLKYEIIVVDNNSQDHIGELLNWQYPDVEFIANDRNLGMGAGNNIGIKQAQGKYIVIMNPDTIAFKDTFQKLYRYMESDKKAGIAGPKQYYPDKTVQASCYRWYNLLTPIYRRTALGNLPFARRDIGRLLMEDFDHNSIREVDWLLGSFLFCRRQALDKAGYFDERYFLYFEDTDLSRRIWEAGWKVVYFPEAEIIHNHVRESAKGEWYKFLFNKASRHHVASWMKYLRKWETGRPKDEGRRTKSDNYNR